MTLNEIKAYDASRPSDEEENDTQCELAAWELLRETRVELETLRDAVRNMRDVKGRFNTQLAAERLMALLPENAGQHPTAEAP